MKEQFSGNFGLDKINTNQNNLQMLDNEEIIDIKTTDLMNFNVKDKFVLNTPKNETEYLLLSSCENDPVKTKQLKEEINQIKNFEKQTKDYFNF